MGPDPNIGGSAIEVWTHATGAGDWSTAGNWYLGHVPQSADHVFFGHWYDPTTRQTVGTDAPCVENSGGVAGTFEVNANYGGTVTLNGALSVGPGGVILSGATINQPNGNSSKITSQGPLDWTNGVLNGSGSASTIELAGNTDSTSVIDQSAATTGDNIIVDTANLLVFEPTLTQFVSFTHQAGLTLNGGYVNVYHNSHTAAVFGGDGSAVTNNAGQFADDAQGTDGQYELTVGMHYIGNGGTLLVQSGTVDISGHTTISNNTASVFLTAGVVEINADCALKPWLGYNQTGGTLETMGAGTANIKLGDVVVSGGSVKPGNGSTDATLQCDGNVSISGGIYYVNIDGGTGLFDQWTSGKTFAISGAASLDVTTTNVSWGVNGPPSPFPICSGATDLTDTTLAQNKWPGTNGGEHGYTYANPGFFEKTTTVHVGELQ